MPSLHVAAVAWLAVGLAEHALAQDFRANQYIVEYASQSNALRARDTLASMGDIRVRKTYNSAVFSGVSIETEAFALDDLVAMPDVANVWRNHIHRLDPMQMAAEAAEFKELDGIVHNTTGVAKLHADGILGEGALVGVVDTGTWYEHPALGGCIGPECKVTGGYDLVGDDPWRPGLEKEPDSDPKDNQGHGTHVAGIVAGENDYWSGVAPRANLRSYKVFSAADSPESDDETVIEAFLMAADDGCDIITCSIGNFNGWPQNAWAVVADRLVSEGIFISVSAGNEGAAGPFFGSTGSSGKDVLAVASISADKLPARSWTAIYSEGDEDTEVTEAYLPATDSFPESVNGWEIRPLNFDTTVVDDACSPYPEDTPKLDGVIPLVRRGTCAFVVKAENLAALGAKYILFYNNEGTITTPQSVEGVLAAMLTAETGAKIIETVKAGGNVTGDFASDSDIPAFVDWPAAGKASDFTSWGALNDLTVKPDIGAPGGQIYSTYLDNGYAVLSGTSMACPYVAGVAALWVSQNGGRKALGKEWARSLGRRIISSGQPIPWYHASVTYPEFEAPVEQVGTGLIDAWKVLNYDTQLDFKTIGLNDTHYFSRYHDVVLTNDGKKSIDYTFSHAPAAGIETYTCEDDDCRVKTWAELEAIPLEVDVNLPRSFTLKPGQSKKVSVNFENPDKKGWNAEALPAYSGNIRITGSNGEELAVPYFGLAANLKQVVSPIYRAGYPTAVSTPNDTSIEEDATFSFDNSDDVMDFPRIVARLKWGSAQIRWDIFESDWTERKWSWPLTPGDNGYVGTVHGLDKSTGSVDYPNITVTFPVVWTNRNGDAAENQLLHEYWWPQGLLGNGSKIEPGKYIMRFAALNPFGVPEHGNNWSVFKTPKITIVE
ncbi:subtilase [Emericellopsis atlantica]|uniref:Subtilase n=1 Tax=Emericellopsis atlantica TaxID=2614577 RepID=A0A9P7ZQY6_9HYPO|nr:subtilase [Emericellopsis atlantica]KAG9256585.1 subtilase [Emericellopsis atlantica]